MKVLGQKRRLTGAGQFCTKRSDRKTSLGDPHRAGFVSAEDLALRRNQGGKAVDEELRPFDFPLVEKTVFFALGVGERFFGSQRHPQVHPAAQGVAEAIEKVAGGEKGQRWICLPYFPQGGGSSRQRFRGSFDGQRFLPKIGGLPGLADRCLCFIQKGRK